MKPKFAISWSLMGRAIRINVLTGIATVLLFAFLLLFDKDVALAVLVVLGLLNTVMAAFLGIVGGILGELGIVAFRCPFCGSPSPQMVRKGCTSLLCPECGEVQAKGLFKTRFVKKG
jgi:hypothetical protein